MCCGGDHDRLTTVGKIGVAERPTGGSGTVAACALYPIKNRRLGIRTIDSIIAILDSLFLVLSTLA